MIERRADQNYAPSLFYGGCINNIDDSMLFWLVLVTYRNLRDLGSNVS